MIKERIVLVMFLRQTGFCSKSLKRLALIESSIYIYTLLCVNQMASGKLWSSTGGSVLCEGLEGWGGGWEVGRLEREGTYVCM